MSTPPQKRSYQAPRGPVGIDNSDEEIHEDADTNINTISVIPDVDTDRDLSLTWMG